MQRLGILVALVAVLAAASSAGAQPRCLPDAVEQDRVRIRAHLREVEAELRAAPTDHLSDAQREARLLDLDRLHDYWVRGEFPHGSPSQPGDVVPTFIDEGGRPCAMAYLVIASGHADVAEEIARTQLHAYVPEIEHPALAPWLEAHGMTVAEAARVQPGYACPCVDGSVGYVCGIGGGTPRPCPVLIWACDIGDYAADMAPDGGFYCAEPDGGSTFPWPDVPAPDAPALDGGDGRLDAGGGLDASRDLDAGLDAGRDVGGAAPDAGMDAGAPPPAPRARGCRIGPGDRPLARGSLIFGAAVGLFVLLRRRSES